MKMTDELRRWNLQLFAEEPDPDGDGGNDPDGAKGKPGDKKDSEGGEPKGAEKKYTDADVDSIVEKKFARWKEQHEKDLKDAKAEAGQDER